MSQTEWLIGLILSGIAMSIFIWLFVKNIKTNYRNRHSLVTHTQTQKALKIWISVLIFLGVFGFGIIFLITSVSFVQTLCN